MQKRNHKSQILPILFCFIACSCGPKTPGISEQKNGLKVTVPNYNNLDSSLSLTNSDEINLNFEGSMLFWSEQAEPSIMSEVLKQSKEVKAADLNYKVEKRTDDRLLQALESDYQTLSKYDAELDSLTMGATTSFYSRQLEELNLPGTSFQWMNNHRKQNDQYAAQLKEFCEVSLYNFANSFLVKNYNFSKRPTVSPLCTNYFKDSDFFTDQLCTDSQSDAGANYFACFWTAIFKTNISFRLKQGSQRRVSTPEDLELIKIHFLDPKTLETSNNNYIESSDIYLGSALIDGQKVSRSSVQASDLFNDPTGKIDELVYPRLSTSSKEYTFNDLLYNIHLIKSGSLSLLQISPEDKTTLANLDEFPSEIFGHSLTLASNEDNASRIDFLRAEQKRLAETIYKSNKQRWHNEHNKSEPLLSEPKESLEEKKQLWLKQKIKVSELLLDHKQVNALFPYTLLNVKIKQSILMLSFSIDYYSNHNIKALGCYDLNSKSMTDQCQLIEEQDQTSEYIQMSYLNFDPETSQIKAKLSLAKASTLGLKKITEDQMRPKYQVWSNDQLEPFSLELDLYARNYQRSLPILTGKARILNGPLEVSQASVALSDYGFMLSKQSLQQPVNPDELKSKFERKYDFIITSTAGDNS